MITANVDMTEFNLGMAGLIHQAGLSSKIVVEKETGELIKTLVRLSPPKERSRSQFKAETDVRSRFEMASNGGYRDFDKTSGTVGKSGIKWYSVDEKFLRGVAPQNDMREKPWQEVYRTFRKYNKKGRIIVNFKKARSQKVMISQKLLTTKSQVRKVVEKVKKNFGRLKAGWLVSVSRGPIRISGGNMPPKWVTDHANGAKGDFRDELSVKETPSFTIINQAKGIGQPAVNYVVNAAVSVRAKAMAKNATLFMSGKKNLSDYSK